MKIHSKKIKTTAALILIPFLFFIIHQDYTYAAQKDDLTKARQLIREGDYEGAIHLLEAYIEKIRQIEEQRKNIAEAYYIIAKIYYTVGESDLSNANLKLVFERYPDFAIDESDLSFQERVDKIRKMVISSQSMKREDQLLGIEKPSVEAKEMKSKKKRFPLAIVLGIALAGVGAYLLLNKKEDSSSSANYEYVTQWGSQGTDDGQFLTVQCIATDSTGYVYVTDYSYHRVQKFTSSGAFVGKWGSRGSENGQFDHPSGIAIDQEGHIYISEQAGSRIQKFDSTGAFVSKWGSSGSGDGEFRVAACLDLDISGMVYVTDFHNNRIQKFASNGTYVTQWGSLGSGDGQFIDPVGIAVDRSSYIYIVDRGNDRIQKFTSDGVFVSKWGSKGIGDGQFSSAEGIAIDNTGSVFVVDWNNHCVQKFTSDGVFVSKWGSEGSGDGQFLHPNDVAVDGAGFVYVTDQGNQRVQKFKISTKTKLNTNISYSPLTMSPQNIIDPASRSRLHPGSSKRGNINRIEEVPNLTQRNQRSRKKKK